MDSGGFYNDVVFGICEFSIVIVSVTLGKCLHAAISFIWAKPDVEKQRFQWHFQTDKAHVIP